MIPCPTFKELKIAWRVFNELPKPWLADGYQGSSEAVYRAREKAWNEYCRLRDQLLYHQGLITSADLMRQQERVARAGKTYLLN